MEIASSVQAMEEGLHAALDNEDWQAAHRHLERLKGIVLEGVARNDPLAIQAAGSAIDACGERLEFGHGLRMKMDAFGMAWQLRADAATAVLAGRIRPRERLAPYDQQDVGRALLSILQRRNAAMTNAELAMEAGKDPATVSRTLKRLKDSGKISQWRVGSRVLNRVRSSWDDADLELRMLFDNQFIELTACIPANDQVIEDKNLKSEFKNGMIEAKQETQELCVGAMA